MRKRNKSVLIFKGVDRAAVLYGLGRNSKALLSLEAILSRNPRNKSALLLMAKILPDVGLSGRSLQVVNRVLSRCPKDFEALLTKAVVYSDMGRAREALRIFAELSKRPHVSREDRKYLYWHWINTLIATKRWRSADSVLSQALSLLPNDEMLNHYRTLIHRPSSKVRSARADE